VSSRGKPPKSETPQRSAPQEDGDLLLEVLKRYGRVSGSIVMPVKIRNSDHAEVPAEIVEILRFDAAPSASTK
jgi:hypothetical protein